MYSVFKKQYFNDMSRTFLSDNVRHLLIENAFSNANQSADSEIISCPESLQFYGKLCNHMQLNIEDDSIEYFEESVSKIKSDVYNSCLILKEVQFKEFYDQHYSKFSWTPFCDAVLTNLEMWKSNSDSKEVNYSTLLEITAILERSLACLYSYASPKKKCPNMLKDILKSQEIRHILGDDYTAFLKILVGPVTSLNLRNLCWHGFLRPCDIAPQYVSIFFFVFMDIGFKLEANRHVHCPIKRHVFKSMNNVCQTLANAAYVKDLSQETLREFQELISQNKWVDQSFRPFYDFALDLLNKRDAGAMHSTISMLLPLLENATRHVYVDANQMSSNVLLAVQNTFFCTFDEMLSPKTQYGNTNKFPNVIGEEGMAYLCDLLQYEDGPRLRDRLSHGEFLETDIKESYVCIVLTAFHIVLSDSANNDFRKWRASYVSTFHPIELCRMKAKSLVEAVFQLERTTSTAKHFGDLLEFSYNVEILPFIFHSCKEILNCCSDKFVNTSIVLLTEKTTVLFRGKEKIGESDLNTLSIMNLLQKIIETLTALLNFITDFYEKRDCEMKNKILRSRQRDNFERLKIALNDIITYVRLIVAIVIGEIVGISCRNDASYARNSVISIFKDILVSCEKAQSLSHKYQWEEMSDIVKSSCGSVINKMKNL